MFFPRIKIVYTQQFYTLGIKTRSIAFLDTGGIPNQGMPFTINIIRGFSFCYLCLRSSNLCGNKTAVFYSTAEVLPVYIGYAAKVKTPTSGMQDFIFIFIFTIYTSRMTEQWNNAWRPLLGLPNKEHHDIK